MTSLQSIVYVSDATFPLTTAELERLLAQARAENSRNGVTGVLFYNDGNIMQCIEGPAGAVASTYERIRASRQHKNVTELMNRPVAQRSFQDWDMALVQPTRSELLAMSTARWKQQAGEPAGADAAGWNLMQAFWRAARGGRF